MIAVGDGQGLRLTDGSEVVVRSIRPDDAPLLQAFVRRLSLRSRRFRFFVTLAELSAAQLERFVNVDPARGLALIALSMRQVQRLPADQREVLMLVAIEGMHYEEVAATIGIPIGTVMSRLSRARDKLRRMPTRQPLALETAGERTG